MSKVDYSNLTEEQLNIVNDYMKDNMRKIKQICYPIWGNKGIPNMEHDDLYDDAMKVLLESVVSYDGKQSRFQTYLIGNIQRSFKEWVRNSHRAKRCNLLLDKKGKIVKDENGKPTVISNISFDTPAEDGLELKEKVSSEFTIEKELKIEEPLKESTILYLEVLSPLQREIVQYIMKGYKKQQIKEKMFLSDKQFEQSWKQITSYENKRILYKDDGLEDKDMNTIFSTEDVAESYKNTSYSIESISKQLKKKRIKDNHILQRHSGRWKKFAKSELVSDVLRGKSLTQIIISEEIKDGVRMQWLIDGKQRCTTLDEYYHDEFAISKNVKNYNIVYQVPKVDEEGNEVLNEEGFPISEFRTFDIRNKKFSQLPEELQDIFKDRQIPVLYNLNCTKKDIADDIARFNRSRPMNKAENGWLGLDESFAELVENISKMQFFQVDYYGSTYTNNNHNSGLMRRIIVESIMVADFIDDYCKDFEKNCEFLSEEASDSNFTEFYSFIERLTVVADDNIANMFNAKDSFLWFGLFSRFNEYGIDDVKFIDFMKTFSKTLHSKKIKDKSFDDLNGRSTKDKTVVVEKMKHLEALMHEFLLINKEDLEEVDTLEFVKENVKSDATEEDVEFYSELLDDLTLEVDNDTKLLDKHNRPSLVALVGYACENDIDLDEWIKMYFATNAMYILNQKQNLHMMINSLQKGVTG